MGALGSEAAGASTGEEAAFHPGEAIAAATVAVLVVTRLTRTKDVHLQAWGQTVAQGSPPISRATPCYLTTRASSADNPSANRRATGIDGPHTGAGLGTRLKRPGD